MANPSSSLLDEAVQQIAEQQHAQASEIESNKAVLIRLQTQLQDLEAQMKLVMADRKATERQMFHQDEAIISTKDHCENLEVQITALYAGNLKLAFDMETLQEEYKLMLQRNSAYYAKMAAHRDQFVEAENKLPLMTELTKKRAAVKEMITNKEELMSVLQNPEVPDEIAYLEAEINALKEAISGKENALREERNVHARLRKEIQVQNKRYEAILKRLHCQVNKFQSSKRQRHCNLQQMEEKVAELRNLLEATD
ncbi:coiled-coil domain-containing protein 122 [Podarcis raffonei]|uniref:coiled-coil domain-containing protein 122 n=1 Tax=Podarcis raffonei TaxID=65483 RepID=UPI0023294E45|nr:coiled-coil domain-containing protein 122 [Podarcis raffonei]XP_053218128.1 coiled-coil domain-containing protein 122 [Podarcis raffonei]XP_053218129.1 coiled-coil domain-containing protein 122 [Podarcis raffonei]XP_053218130.1 coiled-coil domain-containing protein 122 [Podarcis raffonei]